MDGTTHTLLSIAMLGIFYYVGYRQGGAEAFGAGFREGAEIAIDKVMGALKNEFGIHIMYDEEIEEIEDDTQ